MKQIRDLGRLLLGQPALSAAVARGLGTKGEEPSHVESRYQLGINAADLTAMEYRFTQRRPTFEIGIIQAAVAAQFSVITAQINAGGRGTMIVIERLILVNPDVAAQAITYGMTFAGSGGVAANLQGWQCDDRFGAPAARGSLQVGSGTVAASPALATHAIVQLQPGASLVVDGPWVLTGNNNGVFSGAFIIVGAIANKPLQGSLRWYEREPLASEL